MRINRITLQNFRCFELLELDLDPQLTVLVGDNSAGKTALLEGLAVGLAGFLLSVGGARARMIADGDVRHIMFENEGVVSDEPQMPVRVACLGVVDGECMDWARERGSIDGRTTREGAKRISETARAMQVNVRKNKQQDLPLIAYYGTQRLWRQIRDTAGKHALLSRTDGYLDCLDPASNQKHLTIWMKEQALSEFQEGKRLPHLTAIENAVCACIGQAKRFYFSGKRKELVIEWADGRVQEFDELSDGFRNMVATVADIAWRAAVLNPHLGDRAPALSEGVVLIDEIDLHLHPSWQRRVLADLTRAFPRLQFVVTTHSPQVIGEVPPARIRVLGPSANGGITAGTPSVSAGLDSAQAVRLVQHASGRNERFEAKLKQVLRLIDDAETEEDFDAVEAALGAFAGFELHENDPSKVDLLLVPEVAGLRAALFRARTLTADELEEEK